jgi:hypothetical protein
MGFRKRLKIKLSLLIDVKLKARTRKRTENEIIIDLIKKRREIIQFNKKYNIN